MTLSANLKNLGLKFQLIFGFIVLIFTVGTSQSLKKMTPDVYSQWNKIKNVQISDSAEIIVYTLEKELGDKKMAIYQKAKDTSYFFDRVNKFNIDPSGKFVVYTKGLAYDSLRTLKRKKTAKDKIPKDSLTIFDIAAQSFVTIADIEDYKMPEKYSGYCFYTKKIEKKIVPDSIQMDSIHLDSIPKDSLKIKNKKSKNPCESLVLIIKNLQSGTEDTIFNIKEYTFATDFPKLAYTQCIGDSVAKYNVVIKDLATKNEAIVQNNLHTVTQMSFDKKGKHFAFLGLEQKSDAKQKPFTLFLKTANDTIANALTSKISEIKPSDWVISSDKQITWSETGQRMFFGLSPILPIKDTTLLDDEIVNVEIWHYDSPRLYTQQEATLENDRKKAYNTMFDLDSLRIIQLETLEADRTILSKKGDGRFALQLKSSPYQKEVTWLAESRKDFYLIDTKTNQSTLILTGEFGNPIFSPGGRYLYWWSRADSIWKTFDTERSIIGTLGLWSVTKFHDELNDIPQNADAYGIAGWTTNDEAAIVYDRYDLWKINPLDPFAVSQWTNGRPNQLVHRWIKTDPDKDFIDSTDILLLHRFDEKTKATSYIALDLDSMKYASLVGGDFELTTQLRKAKKSSDHIFTLENFETFPDVLWTNDLFKTYKRVSDANPQQKDFAWGKGELFSWTNYRNLKNDGMIFFPPNFDPEKKYPLIVNFYERSSDDFHRHRAPEAHRSTINYSYYTNLGYVILNPDIKYLTGQPGDDCVNAVESGVDALIKTGYIDDSRIALQGHSWGGYQVAYLLTKSERYKCAESGAPVVNMVSAYGGIRWESGMSRMFQYEKTQSRLGATLWEDPKRYHKNSPIYEMTNVTTPVLIMHNDEDGAVPWYQSIEYYMALRRLNKPAWLLNYNNEPHWPVKWQNRLDFNIRMEQFFNHYLMDGPLPLWMKEGNTPLEKGILNKY
jgi:dienelactone hydrolase